MVSIYYDLLLVFTHRIFVLQRTYILPKLQACWKKLFVWEIMGEIQRVLGDASELTSKLSLSYINQPNTCISIT